jgi:4-azaleucine resistance transporter AzlC
MRATDSVRLEVEAAIALLPATQTAQSARRREGFRAGLRDMAPILLSVVPFGLVCGVDAMNAGLGVFQALVFSLSVFAGSSQLVATQLIGNDAPLAVIVFAALTVNLRFLMYSAGMTPYFAHLNLGQKLLYSFLMTDQSYALSQVAFTDPLRLVARSRYYIGASLGLFGAFQAGNLVGVLAGARIPESWGLEFAVPLAFTALLVPALRSRSHAFAGLLAGGLALCLSTLPYLLGVFIAASIAIAAGYFFMGERSDGR